MLVPEQFQIDVTSGCWLWTGTILRNGYGQVYSESQHHYVHRVMYEQEVGPIPQGWTVDHVWDRGCLHKHCGNPDHLEAVTLAENIRRAQIGRPRLLPAACAKGHLYTPENTRMRGRDRICRQCQAEYRARYRQRMGK